MKIRIALILSLAMISLWSCRHNDSGSEGQGVASVNFTFKTSWHDEPFVMQAVYTDAFENRVRIDRLMNYFSSLKLIKDDGSEVLLKDFMLLDYANENVFTYEIPEGKYSKVKFDVGIPRDYNKDMDPAQYPSSSALSVAGSQGMFWSWNTGYIFAKVEGKADTTGTEGTELLSPIAIHAGDDSSFREYETSEQIFEVKKGQTHEIVVNIEVDRLFGFGTTNGIDIAEEAITHTSTNPELATKYMENLMAAIEVIR